jgi:hypothetical protein
LQQFAIFDTVIKLRKLSIFSSNHLPHLSVTTSSIVHRDLAQSYHWTCARTFFFPIFQPTAMALYETGFYEKFQDYFSRYEDYRNRLLFRAQFNCTTNKNDVTLQTHCRSRENGVEGFGIAAFGSFLKLYSLLVVACLSVLFAEVVVKSCYIVKKFSLPFQKTTKVIVW